MGDVVALSKQGVEFASGSLLKALEHVPDDRLTWTPSPTAKSALRIAAHAALSNPFMAGMIRGEGVPDGPMDEMVAQMNAAEEAITSREQVVAVIEEGTAAVLDALDALTPELIESTVETPFMTAPMFFFMGLPGLHMNTHASQIEYLQTIWGDLEFRM